MGCFAKIDKMGFIIALVLWEWLGWDGMGREGGGEE
jgi:hypothetical protein